MGYFKSVCVFFSDPLFSFLFINFSIFNRYDSDSKIHESSKWSNHVLDTLFAKSSIGEYFRKKTKVLYGSSLEPIEEPKKYSNDSIIVHDSNWYNTYEIKVSYTDFPLSKIVSLISHLIFISFD